MALQDVTGHQDHLEVKEDLEDQGSQDGQVLPAIQAHQAVQAELDLQVNHKAIGL